MRGKRSKGKGRERGCKEWERKGWEKEDKREGKEMEEKRKRVKGMERERVRIRSGGKGRREGERNGKDTEGKER